MEKKVLRPRKVNRCLSILLAFFLAVAGFLYWKGYIQELGLVFVAIIVLTAGIVCTFGTRVGQRDGFLDGYARAKNDLDKKKK